MTTVVLPARVLIVDSRIDEGERLQRAMIYDGHQAALVTDTRKGLPWVGEDLADVVVIDLAAAEFDTIALCRHLRARSDVPVLLLGNKGTAEEAVAGLEDGADDYLAPPAHLTEVQARVKALLRRTRRSGPRPTVFRYADLTLDTATRIVTRSGRCLRLTTHEFCLLALFLNSPERVLAHQLLLSQVWRRPATATISNLECCMHSLRVKMEEAGEARLIQSIRGVGYALRAC